MEAVSQAWGPHLAAGKRERREQKRRWATVSTLNFGRLIDEDTEQTMPIPVTYLIHRRDGVKGVCQSKTSAAPKNRDDIAIRGE